MTPTRTPPDCLDIFRRRPTVFDLFPDMGDSGPSEGEDCDAAGVSPGVGGGGSGGGGGGGGGVRESIKHAPAGARDSIKMETARLVGLMKNKFLDRGDDHNKGELAHNSAVAGGGGGAHEVGGLLPL